MSIGEKIKIHRKKAGLTQVVLAEKANMSRSYLADLERNRYNPSLDTLTAIAEALNINVSNLLDEEEKENSFEPKLTEKDERDIQKELQKMIDGLEGKNGYAHFNGQSIDDMDQEDRELLISSLENSLRIAKRLAKQKFTPKKYRD
ncbi:helix-turn-helix transcriptional regulator [Cytobacillus oceanisediminis]|uniref:helix-turn-helix domain-containing protein n=1 Tax=Bacillaceae TaxID=186817 RepID=UPI001CCB8EFA|nr:helix-turn-helix transcriptional regulator [Cytobacillus oceanisediminis]MBZ9536510.1 helix-turn-helix transcriptional regulator [Cytobacillus oceanisediminis]